MLTKQEQEYGNSLSEMLFQDSVVVKGFSDSFENEKKSHFVSRFNEIEYHLIQNLNRCGNDLLQKTAILSFYQELFSMLNIDKLKLLETKDFISSLKSDSFVVQCFGEAFLKSFNMETFRQSPIVSFISRFQFLKSILKSIKWEKNFNRRTKLKKLVTIYQKKMAYKSRTSVCV